MRSPPTATWSRKASTRRISPPSSDSLVIAMRQRLRLAVSRAALRVTSLMIQMLEDGFSLPNRNGDYGTRSRPSGNTCLRLNLDMASDRPQIYSYLVHEMIAFAVDFSNPTQLWLDGPPLRRRQISIAKDVSQVANRANVAAGVHNCLHECRNVFFLHGLHVESLVNGVLARPCCLFSVSSGRRKP